MVQVPSFEGRGTGERLRMSRQGDGKRQTCFCHDGKAKVNQGGRGWHSFARTRTVNTLRYLTVDRITLA